MKLLVTGSSGLIGSEVVAYFASRNARVYGIDNNLRADLFGASGDTRVNQRRMQARYPSFRHHEMDVRDRAAVLRCVEALTPDLLVHAAAQPSHDLAARRPFDDFDVNAVATLNLLEAVREHCPGAVFVYLSTNKVYGDGPNAIPLKELDTRWAYDDPRYSHGIAEDFPVDHCMHSVFGASKLAADVMVQEYGRYFGLKTCTLRGGCLTGPNHAGVELHGFLSYLIRCNVRGDCYRVFGYEGKQVRDNLHAVDVARFIRMFYESPRCGAVYNIGGGAGNSVSILESFERIASLSGKPMRYEYEPDARLGDHMCYISDLRRIQADYPDWGITRTLDDIFEEIHRSAVAA